MASPGIQSIFRGSLHLFSARAVNLLARSAYVLLVTRALEPEVYGVLAYGQSFYLTFLAVSGLALTSSMVRAVGMDRESAGPLINRFLWMQIVAALIAGALCAALGWLTDDEALAQQVVLWFSVALMGRALAYWCARVFVAYEVAHHAARLEALFRPLEVLVVGGVLLAGGGALEVAAVHALTWWGQALISLWLIDRRLQRVAPEWHGETMRALVADGVTLTGGATAITGMRQGALILFRQLGAAAAAQGQLALLLQVTNHLLGMVVGTLNIAALPILSRSARRQDRKDVWFVEVMSRAGLLMGVAGAITAHALGPAVVVLVFGASYAEAGALLWAAVLVVGPMLAGDAAHQTLIARGRFGLTFAIAVVGLAALVGVFVAWASGDPLWALLATGVGAIVWCGLLLLELRRSAGLDLGLAVLRPAGAGVAAAGAYAAVAPYSLWLALPLGWLVLGAATWALSVVQGDEAELLRGIWQRRRGRGAAGR